MVMMRDVVEAGAGAGAGAGAPLADVKADGAAGPSSRSEAGGAPQAAAALENQRLAAAAIAAAGAARRGAKPDAPVSGQIALVGVVALLLAGFGVAVAGRGRRPKSMYHGYVVFGSAAAALKAKQVLHGSLQDGKVLNVVFSTRKLRNMIALASISK